MADIDMELGSSNRALELNVPDNDDLIDYDSDVPGAHDPEPAQPSYDQPQATGLHSHEGAHAGVTSETTNLPDVHQKAEESKDSTASIEAVANTGGLESTTAEGMDAPENGLALDEDYELYDATPGHDGHPNGDIDQAELSELVSIEAVQEMDFGDETDSIMNNGDEATINSAAEIYHPEENHDKVAEGVTVAETSEVLELDLPPNATVNDLLGADTTEVQYDEDINFTADIAGDEITWEENEDTFSDHDGDKGRDEDGVTGEKNSAPAAAETDEGDSRESGSIHGEPAVLGHVASQSGNDQSHTDEASAVPAQDDEDDYESAKLHEESTVEHESVDDPHNDFPAITVQYRGDEYPCFSKSSEGFFADAAVIDHSVDQVLAGFREELSNEIGSEEELVFQVDELGLEFSESYPRESLSSITLRQILEIFDLLVKNQDPNNTRTLYTYLFTKPSTSRRFEFLVESAAAGQGLDEVVYLFESPMPHGPNPIDDQRPVGDEDLEKYDSGADDSREDVNDVTDELEELQDLASAIGASRERTDSVEKATESDQHEENEAQELLEVMENDQAVNDDIDETIANFEADMFNNDASNLINLEIEGPLEDENEGVDTSLQPTDNVAVETVTIEASTTTTDTVDNSTSPVISGDPEVHIEEHHNAQDDDGSEIDWREDDTQEVADAMPPQPATKRGRGDEILDVEDQQDVKRQRS